MLQCGLAGRDITPEPGPVLQGHRNDNGSHAVLYPLEVRAAVFEESGLRVAIAAIDAIGLTLETTGRIRRTVEEATGIPGHNVMIACSHTHCAPATVPYLGSMDQNLEFVNRIEKETAAAISEAASYVKPVTFGLGCGSSHFNLSRRPIPGRSGMALNYGSLVDRRVRVIRLDGEDGSPAAVFFHFSCHTTTKSGAEGYISPDYAGIARGYIEGQLGCPALFLPGCFGNIRPAILGEDGGFTSASQERLEACGHELGREVCRVSGWLQTRPMEGLIARCRPLRVPYGEPAHTRAELQAVVDDPVDLGSKDLGPWARRMLKVMDEGIPVCMKTEMQMVRIGPVLLFAIPGEPVQEIGHAIEKTYRGHLGAEDIWPVGYANDEIGYFCTDRHHEEGGYEPNSFPVYNHPAPFKDEERVILKAAQTLMRG